MRLVQTTGPLSNELNSPSLGPHCVVLPMFVLHESLHYWCLFGRQVVQEV